MRVDLHCHSTCSDGDDAPETVGDLAAGRQLGLFALTDHDTCDGCDAVAAKVPGLIRAVEISCDDDGSTVHVLAYDAGGAWRDLEARLAAMRDARRTRLRVIAAQLRQRNVKIDVEPLIAAAGTRSVGRPDVARLMIAQGIVSSMKEAFSRYLYDGGPGDAPGHRLPIAEALAIGRAAGAKMSLAHPHLRGERSPRLLKAHKADGLDGVEAFYGQYDAIERGKWITLADELGLVCTAGSDRHTARDLQLGVEVPDERADALGAWLGR